MEEIWKDIIGYETLYQVSNLGRIKSLPKRTSKGESIMKTGRDVSTGYEVVQITKNNKKLTIRVHSIVAQAFLTKPESVKRLCVNHKDGVKHHNWVDNLEWTTYSNNVKHAYRLGLAAPPRGEKQGKSKLKEYQIVEIKLSNLPHKELAVIYNVHATTIGRIKSGKRWSHM